MGHFGSGSWNNPSGLVGYLSTLAAPMVRTTASSTTEGTDLLTVVAPRAGMYRVSGYLRVSTAANAATTHTATIQVAYNNGTAITAANLQLNGVTQTTSINMKSTAGTTVLAASSVIYAAAGSSIVVSTAHAVSGAETVGAYDLTFAVEAV